MIELRGRLHGMTVILDDPPPAGTSDDTAVVVTIPGGQEQAVAEWRDAVRRRQEALARAGHVPAGRTWRREDCYDER